MLNKEKHARYIEQAIKEQDMMYLLTDQQRIFTVYWAVNALEILVSF